MGVTEMKRVLLHVLAAAFLMAALYCGLWFISSASLACTACNCEYSLFHEYVRCRQPYYAMLGVALFLGATLITVAISRRKGP